MIVEMSERPPLVQFEVRAIEDRGQTIETGAAAYRNVDFAIITPIGGNGTLVVEREVADWLKYHEGTPQGRYFSEIYKAWKSDQAIPESGTSVTMWPAITPAEVKQLQAGGCRTIEDLAAWPDGNIGKLGMNGPSLKRRAIAFLAAAKDVGRVSEKAAALEARNAELEAQVRNQAEEMKRLSDAVASLQTKGKKVA